MIESLLEFEKLICIQTIKTCISFEATKNNLWTDEDCQRDLAQISKSNKVTVRWIKGYDGNLENNKAKKLARRLTASHIRFM